MLKKSLLNTVKGKTCNVKRRTVECSSSETFHV